jgi:nitrogen fixation-related uncharacterized protein
MCVILAFPCSHYYSSILCYTRMFNNNCVVYCLVSDVCLLFMFVLSCMAWDVMQGQFDDARTNLAIALTAAREGAVMGNYCDVQDLLYDHDTTATANNNNSSSSHSSSSSRKVKGAIIRDVLTGDVFKVRAKSVLLCAGPFTDELRRQANPSCDQAVTGAAGGMCVCVSSVCVCLCRYVCVSMSICMYVCVGVVDDLHGGDEGGCDCCYGTI